MKYCAYLLLLFAVLAFSFTKISRVITGKITDDKGQGIPSASVMIKGTRTGTSCDIDGKYSIKITDDNAILIISAVGFKTKEVACKGSSIINVALTSQSSQLSEVVVTGYASQHKRDITGSVTTVTTQTLLQGRASGLIVSDKAYSPLQNNLGYDDEDADGVAGKFDSSRFNPNFNTEGYDQIMENPYLKVSDNPLSTFSIDVDAASYSNVRRFINEGHLPPPGAVRIEELVNYFSYQYPQPQGNDPFSVNTEMAACPWNSKHKLALIGLQGKTIPYETLPASNLVFLIDVSGSMIEPDKLPLVQASLKLLVDQLRPQDKVSLVAYAGNAGLVLPATSGENKTKIKEAIEQLEGGGSTAGGKVYNWPTK